MQDQLTSSQNRAIALAGLIQAVDLVNELATSGYLNSQSFEACTKSLFITQPQSTRDVYGSLANIERGLSKLNELLSGAVTPANKHIMSYAVGINNLGQKLNKTPRMLNTISEKLDEAEQKVQHFGINHDNTVAHIADIYSQTISTFSNRIQVKGEYSYLQQQRVANQIRALLLSAIRASILWRQNGGNLWKILFAKRALKNDVETLLQRAKAEQLNH